ncbi:hypothetical protein CRE_30944 [Caenorhabditis remanei]|uniref:CX domain-containing protein n=1 Tax=Caenorhabditis remanei TaxID=31234 RepID=E3LTP4_CAERE|nr:hypothetical protein CRE_30944 [Caenorhabditis remanei]
MRLTIVLLTLQWCPLISGAAFVFHAGNAGRSIDLERMIKLRQEQEALRMARAGGGLFGGAEGYSTRGISTFYFRNKYGERGTKAGSFSSVNFGTRSFRAVVFNQSSSQSYSLKYKNSWVIPSFNRPVRFDNREYFWNLTQARENITSKVFCEYQIGEDDWQLQSTTFLDGEPVESIYFGCSGSSVDCCGMYCCYTIGDYLVLVVLLVHGLILVGVLLFFVMACCAIVRHRLDSTI